MCLEVGPISKKSSKRHRRRQQEQEDRKVARHLSKPADALPALPRLQFSEPFYLWQLGLTRECQDDCPSWGELPPVIRRGEP